MLEGWDLLEKAVSTVKSGAQSINLADNRLWLTLEGIIRYNGLRVRYRSAFWTKLWMSEQLHKDLTEIRNQLVYVLELVGHKADMKRIIERKEFEVNCSKYYVGSSYWLNKDFSAGKDLWDQKSICFFLLFFKKDFL